MNEHLGPSPQSDEQMQARDAKCEAITRAFADNGMEVVVERSPGLNHSSIKYFEDLSGRRQRFVLVLVDDEGNASLNLSPAYVIPEGETIRDITLPEAPPVGEMVPHDATGYAAEVVNRVLAALETN